MRAVVQDMIYIPSDWPVTQKLIPTSAAPTPTSLRHLQTGDLDDVLFPQGEI